MMHIFRCRNSFAHRRQSEKLAVGLIDARLVRIRFLESIYRFYYQSKLTPSSKPIPYSVHCRIPKTPVPFQLQNFPSPPLLPSPRAQSGPIARRPVPPHDKYSPTRTHGGRHAHCRGRRPYALRVMAITAKVALTDLLPAVVAHLIHPRLGGVAELLVVAA